MIPRIYIADAAVSNEYRLETAKSHHISKVLRLAEGAQVIIFDGIGQAYTAKIIRIHRQYVYLLCQEPCQTANTQQRTVHIGQAICAAAKMDWLMEKTTELGGNAFTPLLTTAAHRHNSKNERWQRLAIAACEQCGRNIIPSVAPAQTLGDWLAALPARSYRILLSPRAPQHLATIIKQIPADANIVLASGPESGFTEEEESLLQTSDFQTAHLGAYILRAETAALAALAIIHAPQEK